MKDALLVIIPAILATLAAIAAAVLAGRSAASAAKSTADTMRLQELESRLSGKKAQVYEPLIEGLGDLLTPGRTADAAKRMETLLPQFMNSAVIYASDEVMTAFAHFRAAQQASPPQTITLRLTADLVKAIRVDVAGETSIGGIELLGMRITDLYTQKTSGLLEALRDPFDVVCARENWTPPWLSYRS